MADFRGYMIGSFASSRLDRGGIPVVATTGKVSDASAAEPTVDFGINPCQWNSLPPFKQTKDQDRKIKNLEEKVDRMGSSFDELKELLIKKLG